MRTPVQVRRPPEPRRTEVYQSMRRNVPETAADLELQDPFATGGRAPLRSGAQESEIALLLRSLLAAPSGPLPAGGTAYSQVRAGVTGPAPSTGPESALLATEVAVRDQAAAPVAAEPATAPKEQPAETPAERPVGAPPSGASRGPPRQLGPGAPSVRVALEQPRRPPAGLRRKFASRPCLSSCQPRQSLKRAPRRVRAPQPLGLAPAGIRKSCAGGAARCGGPARPCPCRGWRPGRRPARPCSEPRVVPPGAKQPPAPAYRPRR